MLTQPTTTDSSLATRQQPPQQPAVPQQLQVHSRLVIRVHQPRNQLLVRAARGVDYLVDLDRISSNNRSSLRQGDHPYSEALVLSLQLLPQGQLGPEEDYLEEPAASSNSPPLLVADFLGRLLSLSSRLNKLAVGCLDQQLNLNSNNNKRVVSSGLQRSLPNHLVDCSALQLRDQLVPVFSDQPLSPLSNLRAPACLGLPLNLNNPQVPVYLGLRLKPSNSQPMPVSSGPQLSSRSPLPLCSASRQPN